MTDSAPMIVIINRRVIDSKYLTRRGQLFERKLVRLMMLKKLKCNRFAIIERLGTNATSASESSSNPFKLFNSSS